MHEAVLHWQLGFDFFPFLRGWPSATSGQIISDATNVNASFI